MCQESKEREREIESLAAEKERERERELEECLGLIYCTPVLRAAKKGMGCPMLLIQQ